MRTVLVLALIGIFFILSIKSRIAALYTYWWFGVFRPHEWIWDDISSLRLPLIAAGILVIPSVLQFRLPKVNNLIAILMVVYVLLALVADIINGCSVTGFDNKTKTILELAILVFVVLLTAELADSRKNIYWLMFVIAMSIGFHSGKGGISALLSGASYYNADLLKGLFADSNSYALGTGMLLFFMIFCFQNIQNFLGSDTQTVFFKIKKNGLNALLLLIIFGTFYNIVALQSRGSFIATSAGIVIWILLQEKKAKLLVSGAIVILFLSLLVPLPSGYKERMLSAFAPTEDLDASAVSRPHFWNTAMKISYDYPIGTGPGCYPVYYNYYDETGGQYGYYRSVHSSHFQILSDTGYPGAFIWILLILKSYRDIWRVRKTARTILPLGPARTFYTSISNAFICSITVFVMGGAFYEYAYNDIIWLVFALIITLRKLLANEIDIRSEQYKVNSLAFPADLAKSGPGNGGSARP